MKYFLQHKECKGIAFEFIRMPKPGEVITMQMIKLKRPIVNDEILCDKCGKTVYVDNLYSNYIIKADGLNIDF